MMSVMSVRAKHALLHSVLGCFAKMLFIQQPTFSMYLDYLKHTQSSHLECGEGVTLMVSSMLLLVLVSLRLRVSFVAFTPANSSPTWL